MASARVIAEDAPLGVLVWPVRDVRYAPNFTLERVEVVRTANGSHVVWVYESGLRRYFKLGELVICDIAQPALIAS